MVDDLMLSNKILTIDNLMKRGWQMTNISMLEDLRIGTTSILSGYHCPFSKQIQSYLQTILSQPCCAPTTISHHVTKGQKELEIIIVFVFGEKAVEEYSPIRIRT
jgi:hypothetical protein